MTCKIDACGSLSWHLALRGWKQDWLAQGQDNVSEWLLRNGANNVVFQQGSTKKQPKVGTYRAMTLDVARIQNNKQN